MGEPIQLFLRSFLEVKLISIQFHLIPSFKAVIVFFTWQDPIHQQFIRQKNTFIWKRIYQCLVRIWIPIWTKYAETDKHGVHVPGTLIQLSAEGDENIVNMFMNVICY